MIDCTIFQLISTPLCRSIPAFSNVNRYFNLCFPDRYPEVIYIRFDEKYGQRTQAEA